jgi:tetratricopeptide (TPR) repeat protein
MPPAVGEAQGQVARYWMAAPLAELGRFEEALTAASRALEFATRIDRPFPLAGALASIGLAQLYQGRLDDVARTLTRGLEVCRRREVPVHRPWLAASLGYTYALAGRTSEGCRPCTRRSTRPTRQATWLRRPGDLPGSAKPPLLSGQADDAAMWADQALEQARLRGERGHETWALRAQPEVASARTPTAAVKRYHEALAVAGNLGVRPLEARCHLGLAALHRAAGRRDQARAALGRARGPLRSMGMEFWLARARALGLGDSNPS